MAPLRFCMITIFYPPYSFGGDGVFVHRLSKLLARHGHTDERAGSRRLSTCKRWFWTVVKSATAAQVRPKSRIR